MAECLAEISLPLHKGICIKKFEGNQRVILLYDPSDDQKHEALVGVALSSLAENTPFTVLQDLTQL